MSGMPRTSVITIKTKLMMGCIAWENKIQRSQMDAWSIDDELRWEKKRHEWKLVSTWSKCIQQVSDGATWRFKVSANMTRRNLRWDEEERNTHFLRLDQDDSTKWIELNFLPYFLFLLFPPISLPATFYRERNKRERKGRNPPEKKSRHPSPIHRHLTHSCFPKNVSAETTYPSTPVVKVGCMTGAKKGLWFPGISSLSLPWDSALS